MEKTNENELIIHEDFFVDNKIDDLVELLKKHNAMNGDKKIIVVGDSGAGEMAAEKIRQREALVGMYGVSCSQIIVQDTITPKPIEYKAPPIFEESRIVYNPKEKPKPKGKLPRKKQNGYF